LRLSAACGIAAAASAAVIALALGLFKASDPLLGPSPATEALCQRRTLSSDRQIDVQPVAQAETWVPDKQGPPRPPPFEADFHRIEDSKAAIVFLWALVDEAARGDIEHADVGTVIALCEALRQRWPDTWQAAKSKQIVSRCYEHRGNVEEAHRAFLQYIDALADIAWRQACDRGCSETNANRAAINAAAYELLAEADRLMNVGDLLRARSLCETVAIRYPDTRYSLRAHKIAGQCYLRMEQPEAALDEFEQVANNQGAGSLSREAWKRVVSTRIGMNEPGTAIETVKDMMHHCPDTESQAWANYHWGLTLFAQGDYHDAMKKFRPLSETSNGPYAEGAARMVQELEQRIADEVFDDLIR